MRRLGSLLALGLSLSACGAPRSEPVGTVTSAIIGGDPSPASQNFVVEIIHPISGGAAECSGTLVAPNLVLTARHCVSTTPDTGFTCDSSGNGSDGGNVISDDAPSTLYIFTGTAEAEPGAAPVAYGTRLFHDGATNICNHDLALIELNTGLTDVPVATLDLDTQLATGSLVTAVGYGLVADGGLPLTRLERNGVAIVSVGPSSNADGYDVAPNDFDVGESICSGDSGGPAIGPSGAVVGVASSGGNGAMSSNPAASCVGSGTVNLYTETAAFRDTILQAFDAVGATATLTAVPLGESCTSSQECTTSVCATVASDAGMTCTADCSTTACPSGSACQKTTKGSFCSPAPSGGCTVAGEVSSSGDTVVPWGLVLGSMAIGIARKRPRKRSIRRLTPHKR